MFENVKTPCYIIDCHKLRQNCEILLEVKKQTGCKILLAQKSYSCYATYPIISQYLDGTTASGLYEAKLGAEFFGKETHIFAPAYTDEDFSEIIEICDHISFNSLTQLEKHRKKVPENAKISLRVNPLYSEVETEIYNPCAKFSRFGVLPKDISKVNLENIQGLHFHTMCEQRADTLARTLPYIENYFGEILKKMEFLNIGGGQHITKEGFDISKFCDIINYLQNKYNLTVYMEPGEAIALNAGYFVASVLDIVENERDIAILDFSAACHNPDILEMPYRPECMNINNEKCGKIGEKKYSYRFGGNTCLSGDVIGDYSFDTPLKVGDKIIFLDMAIYSMVKNNTFNGIKLPDILLYDNNITIHKQFGYEDFKVRL
ncbi:MAG: carboxynorspermidine decarboxylase [Oscillospiraceae bacterium]|jgi:carboxynorspermidine decarboxylase|nr:carboxynorspermidine decarboxylase [Oscillospiraceae bacterium]